MTDEELINAARELSAWLSANDADMKMPVGMIDPAILADRLAVLSASGGWRSMETAPKDGTEVALFYRDWCGGGPLVSSGVWLCQPGREWEATWEHELGYGDADMWAPMPNG